MKMTRPVAWAARTLAGAFVLAWAAVPAGATTLRHMDFGELVGRADRVVHARVVGNNVHWNEAGTQILTDTTFEVIEEAKGKGPSKVIVQNLGGALGIVEMHEDGTPEFTPGEEVVLFIAPGRLEQKAIVGFSQGVMRVSENPATGRKFVTAEVPMGVAFMQQTSEGLRPVRPVRQRAGLIELMQQVRQMVASGAPIKPTLDMKPRTPRAAAGQTEHKSAAEPASPSSQEDKP